LYGILRSNSSNGSSENFADRIITSAAELKANFRVGNTIVVGDEEYIVTAIKSRTAGANGVKRAPMIEYMLNGEVQEAKIAGGFRQMLKDRFKDKQPQQAAIPSVERSSRYNKRQRDEDNAFGSTEGQGEDYDEIRAAGRLAQKKAGKNAGKKSGTIEGDDSGNIKKDMSNEQSPQGDPHQNKENKFVLSTDEIIGAQLSPDELNNSSDEYAQMMQQENAAPSHDLVNTFEKWEDAKESIQKGQDVFIYNNQVYMRRGESDDFHLTLEDPTSPEINAMVRNQNPTKSTEETTPEPKPEKEPKGEDAYGNEGFVADLRVEDAKNPFADGSTERQILDHARQINEFEKGVSTIESFIATKEEQGKNVDSAKRDLIDKEIKEKQDLLVKIKQSIESLSIKNEGLFKDLTEQRKEKSDPDSEDDSESKAGPEYGKEGFVKKLRKQDAGEAFADGTLQCEILNNASEISGLQDNIKDTEGRIAAIKQELKADDLAPEGGEVLSAELAELESSVTQDKAKIDEIIVKNEELRAKISVEGGEGKGEGDESDKESGGKDADSLKAGEKGSENEQGERSEGDKPDKEKPGGDGEKVLSPEALEKKEQLDLAREAYVQADRRRMLLFKLRRKLGNEGSESGDSEGENGALSEYHSARKNYDEAMTAYLGQRVESGEDFESIANSLKTEEYLKLVEVRDEQRSEVKIPLNLYNVAKGALDKYQKLSLTGKIGIIMTGVGAGIAGGTVGAAAAGFIALGMRAASTASLATVAKGFMNNKINQGAERFSEVNAEKAIEQANKESTEKYLEILQSQFRSELQNSEVANNKKMLATIAAVAGAAAATFALGAVGKYFFGAENAVATDNSVDSNAQGEIASAVDADLTDSFTATTPEIPEAAGDFAVNPQEMGPPNGGVDLNVQDETSATESPVVESVSVNDAASVSESSVDMIDSEVRHESVPIHESLSHTLLHTLQENAKLQGYEFPDQADSQWAEVKKVMNENAERLAPPDEIAALKAAGEPAYKIFDVIQEGTELDVQFNADGSVGLDIKGDFSAVEPSAPEVAAPTEIPDAIDLYEQAGGAESVGPTVIVDSNPELTTSEVRGPDKLDSQLLAPSVAEFQNMSYREMSAFMTSALEDIKTVENSTALKQWNTAMSTNMQIIFNDTSASRIGELSRLSIEQIRGLDNATAKTVDANYTRFTDILTKNLPEHLIAHLQNSTTSVQSFVAHGLASLHAMGVPLENGVLANQNEALSGFFGESTKTSGN